MITMVQARKRTKFLRTYEEIQRTLEELRASDSKNKEMFEEETNDWLDEYEDDFSDNSVELEEEDTACFLQQVYIK